MEQERATTTFTHYETKETRTVAVPTKIQQFSREFMGAFITDEEHYQELDWFRATRDAIIAEVKAEYPKNTDGDIQIKAFSKLRIEFVKKFFPEYAPKERKPREVKPAKIDIWGI